MKAGVIIAVVVGAVAIIFLAVNRGLISSGVGISVGAGGSTSAKGIVAPQPATNYSGYLAASTAPGVSSALNGLLSGLGSGFGSWLGGGGGSTPGPNQGANPASPSLGAQPSGPSLATQNAPIGGALVGPQIDPITGLTYDATSGAAFDYSGLAADNAYDPTASLQAA